MMLDATLEEAAQRVRVAYAAFQQQDYGALGGLFATTGLWHETPRVGNMNRARDATLAAGHPANALPDKRR